jgi:DNA-binding winged helix-turn-helix (wHTH) protein/predicted ATPase
MIRFGAYRLDRAQGLWRDGEEVRVTPKSLSVLCVLAERAGEVISKDELFRLVWLGTAVSDSALTSCIQELRRALGDDAQRPQFIETLHRRGYRFREQISRDQSLASGRVPLAPPSSLGSPIVGRDAVIEEMLNAWAIAERGSRQVLFVTGEAGVGKTTVLHAFRARLADRGPVRTTWGQCVQHYGTGESYQPLLEALGRLCRQPGAEDVIPLLERYSPTWLAQLPALLQPERLERLRLTAAGITRERMLRELSDALEAITARLPLVLWLEDLHWSDLSTLDWIAAFAQRPEAACLLLIGTFRPLLATAPEHPLTAISDTLRMKGFCREIALHGLDEASVADYMALSCPPASGHGERLRRLARLIHEHTGGNPLFVVNVIDDLAARGLLVSQDGQWMLTREVNRAELGIPDDIRRMIGKQVDRLLPGERDILECASVAGASFSTAAAAAAAGRSLEDVESMLTTMARQGQFVREAGAFDWPDGTRGARFDFLHVLYRDVLYQRVPPARLAHLHRQVGIRTEMAYGERAPEIAAELAMHFERSGELSRVETYLRRAAENARGRGAYREAQTHFDRALALLACEPPGPERSRRELKLQIGRGAVIMAARGWSAPEVAEAYSRASELSRELGDTPELFPALWGLWLFYWGRGPLSTAQQLVEELMALAHRHGGDAAELEAHHAAWATAFGRGDLLASCAHATDGIGVYDSDRHAPLAATYGSHDAGTCGYNFLGWALALRGRSDEAHRVSQEGVALARRLDHPFSLALTHFFAAATGHARRDRHAVTTNADAAVAVAREQDFRLVLGWALTLQGWAAVEDHRFQEGMEQIMNGLAEVRATGAAQFLPYFISLKAQALFTHGEPAAGLDAVEEAFAAARITGECFWEAELHRLRGELQLAADIPSADHEAEDSFLRAIDVARNQDARLLVLRSTVSLGRLRRRLKRDVEARQQVLAAVAEISQGIALPDVLEARAFLAGDDA